MQAAVERGETGRPVAEPDETAHTGAVPPARPAGYDKGKSARADLPVYLVSLSRRINAVRELKPYRPRGLF